MRLSVFLPRQLDGERGTNRPSPAIGLHSTIRLTMIRLALLSLFLASTSAFNWTKPNLGRACGPTDNGTAPGIKYYQDRDSYEILPFFYRGCGGDGNRYDNRSEAPVIRKTLRRRTKPNFQWTTLPVLAIPSPLAVAILEATPAASRKPAQPVLTANRSSPSMVLECVVILEQLVGHLGLGFRHERSGEEISLYQTRFKN